MGMSRSAKKSLSGPVGMVNWIAHVIFREPRAVALCFAIDERDGEPTGMDLDQRRSSEKGALGPESVNGVWFGRAVGLGRRRGALSGRRRRGCPDTDLCFLQLIADQRWLRGARSPGRPERGGTSCPDPQRTRANANHELEASQVFLRPCPEGPSGPCPRAWPRFARRAPIVTLGMDTMRSLRRSYRIGKASNATACRPGRPRRAGRRSGLRSGRSSCRHRRIARSPSRR